VLKLGARSKIGTVGLLFLVMGYGVASPVRAQRQPPSPYAISGLRAMLFYEQTGTFSEDVFAEPQTVLRNRRTAQGRSTATLVVVELTGAPGALDPRRKLVFTATDAHALKFRKSATVGLFSEEGKFFIGFWLYDTGCYPVTLTAYLTGQLSSEVRKQVINFTCGD
jgi:hypothetical protein